MSEQPVLLGGDHNKCIFLEPVDTPDSPLFCVFTAALDSPTCAKHLVVMFLYVPLKPLQPSVSKEHVASWG